MQEFIAHEYTSYSDSQLAEFARVGDAQAVSVLVFRYMPYVRKKAARFVSLGCEYEDLIQEGMIGLINAVRAFDPQKGEFKAFVSICIINKLLSAVKKTQGKLVLSLDDNQIFELPNQEGMILSEIVGDQLALNPESAAIQNESISYILQHMKSLLSEFECEVLVFYLNGFSYDGIAAYLHHTTKAVDNALQRVRRKLKIALIK